MPHLWKIKQPYNVSVAASTAAITSLEHADELRRTGELIRAERGRLFEKLQAIPWLKPYPSQANFILCRVEGMQAAGLKERLAQEGILVRYFNKPGLQNCIRSACKPEHTDDGGFMERKLRTPEILQNRRDDITISNLDTWAPGKQDWLLNHMLHHIAVHGLFDLQVGQRRPGSRSHHGRGCSSSFRELSTRR
jgi:hypothetical protein